MPDKINFSGYSEVNGLRMYYEIYGQGNPLVLIHGGGSTIQTSFSRVIQPLAKNRKIIAVELQAHGRTNDRNTALTFEQDADDVAELLKNIQITKADFLGFSNGGHAIIEIAIRHSDLINKIILCSALYKRSGAVPQFWEGFENVTFSDMPQQFKDDFLKVNNNPAALINMFNKDVQRMKVFKDWTEENMKSIKAPTYIINGTKDVGNPEHAVEMYRLIPNCELTILPGLHGEYLGETGTENSILPEITVSLIENFLDK
ncbi:MAG: alpha/beta hydrolase [Ginsengibacter sp.]